MSQHEKPLPPITRDHDTSPCKFFSVVVIFFFSFSFCSGLPITKGKKYVLRTDIIFQRISFALNDTLYFLNDPAFHKAEKHYQKSIVLKAKGKPEQSTKEYLKGLELQAKLCSIPRKELKGEMCPLPATVWKILIDIGGTPHHHPLSFILPFPARTL